MSALDSLRIRKGSLHGLIAILTVYLLCFKSVPLFAEGNTSANYYKDPETLMKEVSVRGAKVVVSELFNDLPAWKYVLLHIEKGQKSWLKAAVALRPGTDAGASEMLDSAVGNALENAPENVFSITLKEFKLEFICDGPDVDDIRYESYDLAMKAIRKRQKQIRAIRDIHLKAVADKCISLLEEAKVGVAQFYSVNK